MHHRMDIARSKGSAEAEFVLDPRMRFIWFMVLSYHLRATTPAKKTKIYKLLENNG